MTLTDDFAALAAQFDTMTADVRESGDVVAQFTQELKSFRQTMVYTDKEVNALSSNFGRSMRRAFDDVILDGAKLSDTLETLAQRMLTAAYSAAVAPLQNAAGGVVANGLNDLLSSVLPFEKGGSFVQGRVVPFASGGIVSSPTMFPMRGATGLMGETGPEAIMPLARGADGRLGVQSSGGGRAVNVTMNITTSDVEGFRRSRTQIAAEMNRLLSHGQRNR